MGPGLVCSYLKLERCVKVTKTYSADEDRVDFQELGRWLKPLDVTC